MVNFLSSNLTLARPRGMSSSQSNPPAFFSDELQQNLAEQSFGIASYKLGPSSAYEATARVDLLEGIQVQVSLSSRGYQASRIIAVAPSINP